MKARILSSLLLASLLGSNTAANAVSGLPYFGERSKGPCSINRPEGVNHLDAGADADEECTTIYVKPPATGSIRLSPPGYVDTSLCPLFTRMNAKGVEIAAKLDADTETQIQDAQALQKLHNKLQNLGGNEAFSQFSFSVSLDWNTLLKAYGVANPSKKIEPMKIVTGLLDARVVNPDSDFGVTDQVASLRIFGLRAKPDDMVSGLNTSVADDLFKKLTKNYDVSNQFLMGASVAGQMGIRLPATCAIYGGTTNEKVSMKSLFAATYTYFYPIQTMSSYTISFQNQERFEAALLEKAKAGNGVITREQVQAIVGKISPIAFRKDGVENEGVVDADYAAKMKEILGDAVMNSVAKEITLAVDSGRGTHEEARLERRCRGGWPFKKCGMHEYKVTVAHIDWKQVETRLHELLQDQKDSVTSKTYRVMYLYNTSSFLNLENAKESL